MLAEYFPTSWSEPLVWTLLHSLWQGLVIMLVMIAVLRIIPSRYSSARYSISISALALMLIVSLGTYAYLSWGNLSATAQVGAMAFKISNHITADVRQPSTGLMGQVQSFIGSNIALITALWMMGAFLFSLRLASGFIYISAVRSRAEVIDEHWSEYIGELAERINLKRVVAIAKSAQIQVPFVIGYFKPLILIPSSMISGLSVEQLEAILVHELMHIKRNDYLVNIVQSFIESALFFNPFVWAVSAMIRTERENCCDDEVIKHSNALAYAHALTHLEELKLSHASLTVSLADNKNQLLKRIKRIMERSVQNYSLKERLVPVVLLVVGLICASWLTIKSPNVDDESYDSLAAGDTTKPKESPRRTTVVRDREGLEILIPDAPDAPKGIEPMEEIKALWAPAQFEQLEEIEALAELEEMEGLDVFPHIAIAPDMFVWDTIPGERFESSMGEPDWETFSEEFQVKFKEKFADFYKTHGIEMEKLMQEAKAEMRQKNRDEFAVHEIEQSKYAAEFQRDQMQRQKEMMVYQRKAMEESNHMQHEVMQKQAQEMKEVAVAHEKVARDLMQEQHKMEEKMKKLEKELKVELVKDGYIDKDEKISTINWDGDGNLTVNGKKIKESDGKKYRKLYSKHFEKDWSFKLAE